MFTFLLIISIFYYWSAASCILCCHEYSYFFIGLECTFIYIWFFMMDFICLTIRWIHSYSVISVTLVVDVIYCGTSCIMCEIFLKFSLSYYIHILHQLISVLLFPFAIWGVKLGYSNNKGYYILTFWSSFIFHHCHVGIFQSALRHTPSHEPILKFQDLIQDEFKIFVLKFFYYYKLHYISPYHYPSGPK